VPLNAIAAAGPEIAMLKLRPEPAPAAVKSWDGAQVFRIKAVTRRSLPSTHEPPRDGRDAFHRTRVQLICSGPLFEV
jgi:hypothetical protein